MAVNPADVARAYANATRALPAQESPASVGESEGPSFGDFLKDQIDNVVETGKTSERTAIKAMSGDAELVDVVTAISAAEVTLETVVAVRDKVIGAYNEIQRMPI